MEHTFVLWHAACT